MKKLFIRLLILLFPLLIVGGYFVIEDPMKIIHNTKNPVTPGVLMNDRLYQARFLIQTKTKYNSFIFGSSRSKAFKTPNWKKYLDEEAIPYHMGVNDESIYGIFKKIAFLDQKGFKIKNVLIQMDPRLLSMTKNSEAHVFRDYYLLSGESASSYYQRFFTAFLNANFLRNYATYKSKGIIINQQENIFLWNPGFECNTKTGDIYYSKNDRELKTDSLKYYKVRNLEAYDRTPKVNVIQIKDDCKNQIKLIHQILMKHHTKVKIVLSPNFDRNKVNPKDVKYLKSLFGVKNVHDFSGKNIITENVGNYYEDKHFKPYLANSLLEQLYK